MDNYVFEYACINIYSNLKIISLIRIINVKKTLIININIKIKCPK